MMSRVLWPAAYVLLILIVNYGFSVIPVVSLGGGEVWPPLSLAVGLIFVVRDYAQRQIGHWVLPAMLLGGVLSYVMADPFVAIASITAFLVSELADWAVYSFTKRPFHERILWSSIVGTPLDSAIFLAMIGAFGWVGVIVMTASKLVGALVVWRLARDPLPRHPDYTTG
tara:strand:+ start:232 stop:738 length:507 start_codon:yes stop_codon:yes gene_type:complete